MLAVALVMAALGGGAPASAGLPPPAPSMSVGTTVVTGVAPPVSTPSGPVTLVTKNALADGAESTALMDLLAQQIERQQAGDIIRLTTWSFHSQRIADALIAAHRRGVTVRVVVDQDKWKLSAVRSLRRALGTTAGNGSYIVAPYTQSTHTKVATFSTGGTVLISSGNVSNPRQWNHTVVFQNSSLYQQTSAWADKLGAGNGMRYTKVSSPGVTFHFYPGTVDPVLDAIRNANGEPISVQMYIWKNGRGEQIAQALIEAHRNGSPIAINTGEPWSDAVRSVAAAGIDVFDTRKATGGRAHAHDKLLVVGDDVYTGSTNWGAFPRRFSEVVAHIESRALADVMRGYVSTTRVQAGGSPIDGVPAPRSLTVTPLVEGATARWSTVGRYDYRDLESFQVRVVREQNGTRTQLAQQSVLPRRTSTGAVDPSAELSATFTGLPGGVGLRVEQTPIGDSGPLSAPQVAFVTPYLARPGTPTSVVGSAIALRRAAVTVVPADLPGTPPRAGFQVRWSPDGGTTWRSKKVGSTTFKVGRLTPGVRIPIKVRELPEVGSASSYSATTRLRSTLKPGTPEDVGLRLRRPGVVAVLWDDPRYRGRTAITHWVVRYRVGNGGWDRERKKDTDVNRLVLRGLPRSGSLVVQVAAVNGNGRGSFSGSVTIGLAS